MSRRRGTVVVVDDEQDEVDLLANLLRREGHSVTSFTSPEDALAYLEEELVDVLISDISMRPIDGLELCARAQEAQTSLPVILVTGHGSTDIAVRALRAGAFDLVLKPPNFAELALRVERAISLRGMQREFDRLDSHSSSFHVFASIVGDSRAMRRVFDLIRRVAPRDATVLLCGETGTGKEVVARAIHAQSTRRKGPFVAINCAAVPATILESQLFGHVRGAFTDAKHAHDGLFLAASGGTLFLDEVGELPLELQPKLLRALQERAVRPIGSNQEISFDTRVVAATNKDLEGDTAEGRFRRDLFYRLNVIRIDLPPLRVRGADVLEIARRVLARVAPGQDLVITAEAAKLLMAYDWPGNVRELENCMERAVALARGRRIGAADLPDRVRSFVPQGIVVAAHDVSELVTLEQLEVRYVRKVINLMGGNKSRAAEVLGCDRRTLYRKLASGGKSPS